MRQGVCSYGVTVLMLGVVGNGVGVRVDGLGGGGQGERNGRQKDDNW